MERNALLCHRYIMIYRHDIERKELLNESSSLVNCHFDMYLVVGGSYIGKSYRSLEARADFGNSLYFQKIACSLHRLPYSQYTKKKNYVMILDGQIRAMKFSTEIYLI